MADSSGEREPLEVLAEQFLDRYRNGERPPLSDYTSRHPELADGIHDLFPTLLVMEELRPGNPIEPNEPRPESKRLPEHLGEYRLLREVGRGGMGVVYEAVQESLGRRVALKVLSFDPFAHPKRLDRFHREAQAVAKLHHSNIVPVFGVGNQGGIHFFAMQFIDGCGLDRVIHAGAQAPAGGTTVVNRLESTLFDAPTTDEFYRRVARIGAQVAEALAYAHLHGILHRDIKPSNLLLDADAIVWVTDFGLAKSEDAAALTESGDIVGTLRYMAPERFRGDCDARSDVYSLGATLYELLALRPLFDESDRPRLIDCIQHREPAPLQRLDPRIPRDLETVVTKALAKEPSQRYASAHHLAEDLHRFVLDRPVFARRTKWWQRSWRWCRRNPLASSLGLSLFIALAAGMVLSAILAARANDAAGRAEDSARQANRNAEAASSERNSTEVLLYDARAILALREYRDNNLDHLRELLDAMKPLPGRPDLRHFEWHYLNRLANPDNCLAYKCIDAAMTPDGRYVACARKNKPSVEVWERVGGTGFKRIADLLVDDVRSLTFSPNGHLLAIAGGREWDAEADPQIGFVRVWDLVKEKWLPALERRHTRNFVRVQFSPDGRYLGASTSNGVSLRRPGLPAGVLHVLDVNSGCGILEKPAPEAFSFTPNNLELATAHGGVLHYWKLAGNFFRFYLLPSHGRVEAMAFNPNGDRLATGDDEGTVRVYTSEHVKELALHHRHRGGVTGVAFLASGKVASAGEDGRIEIWNPLPPFDGSSLRGHTRGVSLAASRDGMFLLSVSLDGEVRQWDTSADSEARILRLGEESVWTVSFDGMGKWLVAVTGKKILLLKAAGKEVVRSWDGTWSAVQSHNGRFLAGCHPDGAICLWRLENGEEMVRFPLDPAVWQALQKELRELQPKWKSQGLAALLNDRMKLALSRDDGLLAVQLPGRIVVWDLQTRQERSRILFNEGVVLGSMAFSDDGKRLAWADGRTIWVWDLEAGKSLCELGGHDGEVTRMCFRGDGRLLMSGCKDGTINVWDVERGEVRFTLRGHTNGISALALSADGRRLASASSLERLGTVKVWDMRTGQETFAFERSFPLIQALAFSPDGRRLAIAADRLWVLDGTNDGDVTRGPFPTIP